MSNALTIEPIGEVVEVRDGQTILDACLRSGIWLPHACGHGLCGSCKIDVLEGEVDHGDASSFALMDFERSEGKALACCARLRSDVTIEADLDEDPDARHIAVRDYTGTVAGLVDLSHDIKGVFIELPDEGVDFQAGQYINLKLPGIEPARPFSLANPPSQHNLIELHVRRVPGGQATGYIHDQLREGDPICLAGPYGRFFVHKSAQQPMIFLAGGSGLSSPKSMILDLLGEGCTQPIMLLHGVRSLPDLYNKEALEELAILHPNFTYAPVLSEKAHTDEWQGEIGYVHEVLQRKLHGQFAGHQAYLCGPPPMIEACIRTLMQGCLFEKNIHTEKFLTAADAATGKVRGPVFRRI